MRLAVFGTIAAATVSLAAYDKYDKSTNFQSVDARISAVNEQCYMEKVEGRKTINLGCSSLRAGGGVDPGASEVAGL